MGQRRTTVLLDEDVLATLGFEARRRNVSVAEVVREAVEAKVVALRAGRRPRVGVASSSDGRTAAEVTAEPIAEAPG